MKLLLVHLSDLHIRDENGNNKFQVKKLVDAMAAEGPVEEVMIVVSGDLAHSGETHQYTVSK